MRPGLAGVIDVFSTGWKPRFDVWTAAGILDRQNGVGGSDVAVSLAFGRTPPVVVLERMTIERLMLALVVAAAVVPR